MQHVINIIRVKMEYFNSGDPSRNTKKKLSCWCDSRSYCLPHSAYGQTIKPVSVTSRRTSGYTIVQQKL